MAFEYEGVKFSLSARDDNGRHRLRWFEDKRRKSKHFKTAKSARIWAKSHAEKLSRGGLQLSGQDAEAWTRLKYHAWQRKLSPMAYLEMLERENKAPAVVVDRPGATVAEAVGAYLRERQTGLRPLSESGLGTFRNYLGRLSETFADRELTSLESGELKQWISDQRAARNWSPRTLKNCRDFLSTFFRWLESEKWVEKNPIAAIPHIPIENSTPELWTPEELSKILTAARRQKPKLLAPMAIMAFAGARTYEVSRLAWSNFRRDHLEIPAAANRKTKRRRLVPVLDPLTAWLEDVDRDAPLIQHDTAKQMANRIGEFTKAQVGRHKRNGFRKTFISAMVATGESLADIRRWCGNSEQMIQENYEEAMFPEEAEKYLSVFPTP